MTALLLPLFYFQNNDLHITKPYVYTPAQVVSTPWGENCVPVAFSWPQALVSVLFNYTHPL